ncbi:DMT family transporter [Roseovarius indicus]|uniref:DMT family transporter n=1 Tax=Roseovarius indicus TaxID=540747 RepID=UPI0032EB230C
MAPAPSIPPAAGLMMAGLATVWGGSFFFAEIALQAVPPLTIALHRVVWALPVLALVIRLRGIALPRSPRIWAAYLVMGALNNAIPFSLIFWGQTRIDSGLASILNGTTAVFGAVVAGLLLADEPLTPRKITGALFGLAGVAAIMGPGVLTGLDPTNLAQLAVLGAALSYALASVWGRAMLSGPPPEMNALGMLTGSTLLMIPVVLLADGPPQLALPAHVWAALLGLSTLSTALAYLLYFGILRRAGAANLMLVTLMIPPVAVTLGAAGLGERLSPGAFAGFGLIALGLIVTDGRLLRRGRVHWTG